jgi:hypothetical protein
LAKSISGSPGLRRNRLALGFHGFLGRDDAIILHPTLFSFLHVLQASRHSRTVTAEVDKARTIKKNPALRLRRDKRVRPRAGRG